ISDPSRLRLGIHNASRKARGTLHVITDGSSAVDFDPTSTVTAGGTHHSAIDSTSGDSVCYPLPEPRAAGPPFGRQERRLGVCPRPARGECGLVPRRQLGRPLTKGGPLPGCHSASARASARGAHARAVAVEGARVGAPCRLRALLAAPTARSWLPTAAMRRARGACQRRGGAGRIDSWLHENISRSRIRGGG